MANAKFQISVDEPGWKKSLPDYKKIITSAISAIQKHEALPGEISILLTNDRNIQKLNKDYRGKDKPTNVLSFPQDEIGLLGDIALALETLKREASEQGKNLKAHFTHLLVHGVLHLSSYDHETDEEQKEMEELETQILNDLGISDPYI